MAVLSVYHGGGLLDLMETSPTYRQYGIATHMLYVIQAIVHACVKNDIDFTLRCITQHHLQ